jgi:iron complex outermembrane recepter protein
VRRAISGYTMRIMQPIARSAHRHGLTLTGAASWNSSNQTNSPYLIGVHGQPITSIPNPYGPLNSSLAMSPPFQANLRVRYELAFGEYTVFWQVGGVHQAHSYSATGNVEAYNQPGFTTYDASLGATKDAWSVSLYGQNVTDTTGNHVHHTTNLSWRTRSNVHVRWV